MTKSAYEVPEELSNRDKKFLLSLLQIKSIKQHPSRPDGK
jgi:hypothetical protein